MFVMWILFAGSIVILPGTALLAFWWASRNGEFNNLQRTALSIFNEEEPVGQMSDHFPQKCKTSPAPGRSNCPAS